MQFWQPCWKIFARRPNIFRSISKIGDRKFSLNVRKWRPKFYRSLSGKDEKSKIVSGKLWFIKLFLRIGRMHFWHSYRQFFVERPKIFRSKSEIIPKIIFFWQKILPSWNCSSGLWQFGTEYKLNRKTSQIHTHLKKFVNSLKNSLGGKFAIEFF